MRPVRLLTVGLMLALLPAGLAAQSVSSPYRFIETRHSPGIFGGYLLTDSGALDLGPRSAPTFGVRYGLYLTGPLSVEASLGFASTDRQLYARTATGGQTLLTPLGEVNTFLLMADGALKLRITGARAWRGIAPFGLLGAGLVADLGSSDAREAAIPEEQRFDIGPSFAALGGLGTDFFVGDSFSLRVDVRDYLWRLSYPAGLTGLDENESDWTNNVMFTLGGAIHF
ncbi:MAG: outer membrane beta-barrel protein [Gemmatimonas sp.]|nr:outer membrane beta-barrel protein [Gemmatimonas sp.]